MSLNSKTGILQGKTLDRLLNDLDSLKENETLSSTIKSYLDGDYTAVLQNSTSRKAIEQLVSTLSSSSGNVNGFPRESHAFNTLTDSENVVLFMITGLAAFDVFLQANVTGPPVDLRDIFSAQGYPLREQCLKSLEVDGVSVYQHIPHVELFCLARLVFLSFFPRTHVNVTYDSKWMRVRINAYHQRLLSGSSGGRLSESTVLQDAVEKDLAELEKEILGSESKYTTEAKVQFLLEKAQIYIMEGLDYKAKENVKMAKTVSGFNYALSGALGKRTKFQENAISQLVVFAKSRDQNEASHTKAETLSATLQSSKLENGQVPTALELNDDTLLESIAFTKTDPEAVNTSDLPPSLSALKPDAQPQLKPLDQITLLAEATLKDSLSPLDKLNREEILPFAERVLNDKPTNWQIYTQALLVRSRIESHGSRTQERSVLQLQAIVDQIIADTEQTSSSEGIPSIQVTQFLPRAKASESAPVTERLQYIHQLQTPTRWELESELAYAWSAAGSFISALEIFKRLRLWAEVALCYHTVNQVSKARSIIRRQLYFSSSGPAIDEYDIDAPEVASEKWDGEIRPTPPHAPRLWCILGDLDEDPSCWERAWLLSKNRYARAQRSLGDYFTREGELDRAREAYMHATRIARQHGDTWSRLGDIDLAVGNWDGAIIAFQQAIMIDDDNAKTYSNLGSALLSKHGELVALKAPVAAESDDEDVSLPQDHAPNPKDILRQALQAYKKGAALAHDNWKIWDNVITIAGRMSPPSFPEILLGTRNILRIRAPSIGEDAVDIEILRALVLESVSQDLGEDRDAHGVYTPPRGSLARATLLLFEDAILPLITKRAVLYTLAEKLALYRRDFVGALAYAEKAWRVSQGEGWLVDGELWGGVVAATDGLVSAYENYGPRERVGGGEIEGRWRAKARSALRGVMGKARDAWEGTSEWGDLEERLEELKD